MHVQIIGIRDVLEGSLQQFLAAIAGDVAEFLVDQKPTAIEGDLRHADRGQLKHGAKTAFAFAQYVRGGEGRRSGEKRSWFRPGNVGHEKSFVVVSPLILRASRYSVSTLLFPRLAPESR